ncbi:MAG: tetratricopeptide repeat protein [Ignavibacteriales bacterium]|nr:tetratricopeptide repeat protein [Ignavibacteriales bacterium]
MARQTTQTATVYLNQLDFSRYPKVDLFVTLADKTRQPLLREALDPQWIAIQHKGSPVRPTEVESVIDLKFKGESELFLAMIFDNSTSMQGRTALLETAAAQFIDSLKTGDYVALFDFGDGKVTTKVPEFARPVIARARTPFSNSKPFLHKSVRTGLMTERTFMYDALLLGLSTLNASSALGRKAVVLFSDGDDNGSVSGMEKIREMIRATDIPIYAIDLNVSENAALKDLATRSGGEYFFVRRASDLAPLYQTILQLLRSQYRITYGSPESAISGDAYPVQFQLEGPFRGWAQKTFFVDGENIGFYTLVYTESIGGESLRQYLEYLSNFPASKHADQVRLRIGRYWQRRGEFAKALAVFNMILRNPASAVYNDVLLEKAELYKNAKEFKAAQDAYNEILKSQTEGSVRARALLELAKSYTAEGNFAMALNTYSTLSSQYEGTELASEAFLQSAALSMEMGDLPAAAKNLEQVVTNYGDSRTAVFARIELGKIAEQEQRFNDAVGFYREALASNLDPDIREDLTLRLGSVLSRAGMVAEAVEQYQTLAEKGSSEQVRSAARMELVPSLLVQARTIEARGFFEQLSSAERRELATRYPLLPLSINGSQGVALTNGATILHPILEDGSAPLTAIQWPEASEKFPTVGPLYSIRSLTGSSEVIFPVEQAWIERSLVVPGKAGVYHFRKGNWEPVTKRFDAVARTFTFVTTDPGVYAILAAEPRIIRLYNIYFDLGKATIRKEAERNLYEIVDAMKGLPHIRLEIAGHTDSTGKEEENIDLSSRRAHAISDFLIMNGISPERLIARGYGSQYPIASNDTPENLQKNRRSEFTMISTLTDPVRPTAGAAVLYTVVLKEFRTAKDAYEEKRLYQGRGFPIAIVTSERSGGKYELTLGTYESREEAEKVIAMFKREFKAWDPTIVESKGIQ